MDNKSYIIQSQIFKKQNYVNKLITKIKFNKNQIITNAYALDKSYISVFELSKGDNISMSVSPTIYKNTNKLIIKWSVNTINCIA